MTTVHNHLLGDFVCANEASRDDKPEGDTAKASEMEAT
jgi:hypothetical protein